MTTVADLSVLVGADIAGLTRGLRQADRMLDGFHGGVAGRLNALSGTLRGVGQQMTLMVSAPLAALGGLALSSAIQFESAFAGVVKTVDASEAELAALRDTIRDMATDASNPVAGLENAAVTLAQIAESAGQLGVATEFIDEFTAATAMLDMSTNLTADAAATMSAQFANITGMDLSQIGNFGSTVVALGNAGASTEQEILGLGLRIAAAGKQAGLSEAQILGLSSAMASLGLNEEMAGTAMTRVINELAKAVGLGNDNLRTFAELSGMTAEEFQRAWGQDAAGALAEFLGGLGQLDQAAQLAALEQLGLDDIRVSDTLRRLAGNTDLLREQLGLATEAWSENTALTTEAQKRFETTAAQLNLLKNNLRDVGISIGSVMLPVINKLVGKLAPLLQTMANANPEVLKMAVGFGLAAAAAGPLLTALGLMLTPVGLIAGGIFLLVEGVGWLLDEAGLLQPLLEDISGAFDRLAVGAEMLKFGLMPLLGGGKADWTWISAGLREIGGALKDVSLDVLGKLVQAFESITGIDLSPLGAALSGALTALQNFDPAALAADVKSKITDALNGLTFEDLSLSALGESIRNTVNNAAVGLSFDFSAIAPQIDSAAQTAINLGLSAAALVIGGPVGLGISLARLVATAIENDFLGIGTLLRESGIAASIEAAFGSVKAQIESAAARVFGGSEGDALAGLAGVDVGAGGLAGILEGALGALSSIQLPDLTPIINALGPVLDMLKGVFAETWATDIAPGLQDIGAGLSGFFAALGETDTSGLDEIGMILGSVLGGIVSMATTLVDALGESWSGILSGIGAALPQIGQGISQIVSAFSLAAETGDVGLALTSLASGVGSLVSAAGGFAKEAADGVIGFIERLTGLELPDVDEGLRRFGEALSSLSKIVEVVGSQMKIALDRLSAEINVKWLEFIADLRQRIVDATSGTVFGTIDIAPGVEAELGGARLELDAFAIAEDIQSELQTGLANQDIDVSEALAGAIAFSPDLLAPRMSVVARDALTQALALAQEQGDIEAVQALMPLAVELDIPIADIQTQLQDVVDEASLSKRYRSETTADVKVQPGKIDVKALYDAIVNAIESIKVPKPSGGSPGVPAFQTGGVMREDGLAYLHANERVLNAAETRAYERGPGRRGGDTFYISSYGEDAYDLARLVMQAMKEMA